MPTPRAELFCSIDPQAQYAVDLIYRMVQRIEPHVNHDLRAILGPEMWSEVCHAIGWDIDWDAVSNA